jgi:hypothetical protein
VRTLVPSTEDVMQVFSTASVGLFWVLLPGFSFSLAHLGPYFGSFQLFPFWALSRWLWVLGVVLGCCNLGSKWPILFHLLHVMSSPYLEINSFSMICSLLSCHRIFAFFCYKSFPFSREFFFRLWVDPSCMERN